MALVLTVIGIFALLIGFETWWRKHRAHNEFSRKFIHIVVGSFVAFWPFYMSWNWIIVLSIAFVIIIAASKYFHIFQSIHAVERPTWGEIFFAVAVGLLAFITHEPWVYAAALLHMSLADGLAAVTGVTWGKMNSYKVFGHPKSIVGSATFFIVSVILLTSYSHITGQFLSIDAIAGLALLTTAVENVGVQGLDNLFVPVIIGIALSRI
jgi:phytol kinase